MSDLTTGRFSAALTDVEQPLSGDETSRPVVDRETARETSPLWADLSPPYSTIVADPPWPYEDQAFTWQRRKGKSNFLPYSTMTLGEIAALPVMELAADGAHLYIWTTNRFVWAARDLALGWGFEPAQLLVWCKPVNGIPVGTYNSNSTEFILFARRTVAMKRDVERAGSLIRAAREAANLNRAELHRLVRGGKPTGIVQRWEDDDSLPNPDDWTRLGEVLPSLRGLARPLVEPAPRASAPRVDRAWFQWPRAHHSAKPPAFLSVVEQASPGPYVELFSRDPHLGWDSWGHGYEIHRVGEAS